MSPDAADAAPGPGADPHPELVPGRTDAVAPGVRRIIAPNPGIMTGPGTNTYLLGSGRVAVVDPGPDDDDHLAAILSETGKAGEGIGWILVTHTHIDHSPLAARLKAATGADVIGFGPAPAGQSGPTGVDPHDATFDPDRRLVDGERLDVSDVAVEAVYTPGHTSNHLCYELAGTGLLFSGDHVMSGSTVVIAPPDGDMAVYMESLEKVKGRALRRIGPGHGGMIDDPASVLDGYLRHRREREEQVLAELRRAGSGSVTVEQIVAALYVDVPAELHPVARYSVWAHLRKLAAERRARSPEPDDLGAPWTGAATAGR